MIIYLFVKLKDDPEYAQMWLESLLDDYSETKDVNDLIYNLRPLIETNNSICDFAKLIGIHRITKYWNFAQNFCRPGI